MARDLKLQVILDAVDKATRPLKAIDRASQDAARAMKENRDRLKQLQTVQKDVSSFRTLKNQSAETAKALRDQQDRIRRLSQQMQSNQGDTAALAAERRKAIEQARKLTQRYDNERQQLQRLRTSLNGNGVSTSNLTQDQQRLAREMQQASQAVEDQRRKLKQLADQQKRLAQARQRYDSGMSMRNNLAGTGASMAASGGAALYAGAQLLQPGVAYGEQMSAVQAVGRFTKDDPRFRALQEQSRQLGATTAFSATEVGAGQEFLLRAGMSADAIKASMGDVLALAIANNTELGRTADIASNIAGTFKIDLEQDGAMARVADVLSATASRANVDLEKLGNTVKYLGGAADLNISLEQATAMAGILGNIGIQGEMAGTAMRAMKNRLTGPTKAAASIMEELGLKVADAQGNMRDLPAILADIEKATASLGNVERTAALQEIFGAEAGSGMSELVDAMGEGRLAKLIEAVQNAQGENARMASTMADNIAGDLKNLSSAWDEVGISITDTNQGPLRELIQNVTAITRGVGNWIKANPQLAGTLAKVAAVLAVLVTAGGALTLMLASLMGPMVMVRYGLAMFGPNIMTAGKALLWLGGVIRTVSMFLLANPIGIAIAAIAAAAYLIYRYWEPIKAFFQGLWQQVKDAFSNGIGGVAQLLLNWSPLGLLYRGITAALSALGIEIPDKFKSLGSMIIDGLLGGLGEKMGALKNKITGIAGSVTGWFKDKMGIHSPSRVFAQLGGYTVDGLNQGLDAQRDEPARRVLDIAKRVTRAGAGMAIGAAALPAAAMPGITQQEPIQFDTRPAMTAPASVSVASVPAGGDTITINVYGAPGQDERTLAQEIGRVLEQRDREKAARMRSSLRDID